MAPVLYVAVAMTVIAATRRGMAGSSRASWAFLLLLPFLFAALPLLRGDVLAPADIAFSFSPQRQAWAEYGVETISAPNFSDLAVQLVPWQEAVRFAWRNGEPPLWNPFVLGGDPLVASMQPAPAYPLHLLGLLLPLADAVGFVLLSTIFLAAFGMYLVARELRCGEPAALFGAVAYGLSSYVFFWSHWNVGYVASLAPWVLLAVRRLACAPSARTFWAGAAAATVLLTAGHPESVLVLALPALALFLASLDWSTAGRRIRAGALGIAAALVALGLTAPLYLPFAEALQQSFEHEFRKSELYRSVVGALPPSVALDRASATVLPYTRGVFGLEVPAKARGGFSGDEATGYAGTIAFAFALVGVLATRRRARWAFGALALLGVTLACRMPGLVQVVQSLPLFDVLIFDYFYLWAALGVAGLAALGFDAWSGGASGSSRRALLGAALIVLVLALATAPALRAEGLSRQFLLARGGLAVIPLLGLLALDSWRRLPRFAAQAAIALLLAQRVLEMGHQFPSVPRDQFYPAVAPIDRAVALSGGARVSALDETLVPNTATMFGLRDVRGYNALSLGRWKETTPLWARPGSTIFDRIASPDAPLLSFLNVALLLAGPDSVAPPGWRVVAEAHGTRLMRNPRPGSGAYVPAEVRIGGNATDRLAEMAKESDFAARAWIDSGGRGDEPMRIERNGPGRARAVPAGTGYRILTSLSNASWVVVPVTHWKGWRAFDGGRELTVAYADHAFVAFRAPAGERTIELVYRPRTWAWGLRVAGLTIAVCTATAFGLALRARRGPTSS